MIKLMWSLSGAALALALGCGGGGGGGATGVACPAAGLPSPNPSYADTVAGLVVVPARSNLRAASEAEVQSYRDFVEGLQAACGANPLAAACELGALRAALVALPAPDHPAVFADIEASFDAALDSAHDEFPLPDRDCGAEVEAVCDARAMVPGLARAVCELSPSSETGGHS